MKYSFIVPVFNGEKYIEDCLESIEKQKTDDYELLIINDGSNDQTEKICLEFAKNHSKCRVYSKPNEGLLLSRRYGLRLAKGEWIVFVDADDYLDDGYISTIDKYIAENNDADLIIIAYRKVSDEKKYVGEVKNVFVDGETFSSDSEKYKLFQQLSKNTQINVIWGKIAKRCVYDIDTDYSSFGKVKGEDVIQSVPLFDRAHKVVYCNQILYNYRLSDSGLGRKLKSKYVYDYSTVYGVLFDYIQNHYPNDLSIKNQFFNQYYSYMVRLMRRLPQFVSFKEYKKCTKFVGNDFLFNEARSCVSSCSIKVQARLEIGFPIFVYVLSLLYGKIRRVVIA